MNNKIFDKKNMNYKRFLFSMKKKVTKKLLKKNVQEETPELVRVVGAHFFVTKTSVDIEITQI